MEDRAAGDVLDFKFSTSLGGTPTTLAGTPAISVYKDNSTTESTAGVSLTVDFDSRTGLNHVHITTVTDGTFYANGSDFQLVITAGTVGGLSVVGLVVGEFSLANRAVNWGKLANPTTSNGLTGTTIATSQVVASVAGAVGSVTGAVGSVTGAVGSVTGAVGSVTGLTASNLDATISSRTKPADTQAAVTLVTTTTNLTNAPTAGDLTATMKTSVTTAATAATPTAAAVTGAVGSVTGAVGSVTGAVGSVTGNVGGSVASVTGAVGSVTGAVASVTGNVGGNVVGSVATVTELSTTAQVELSAVPASTATLKDMIKWLYLLSRNKLSQTATTTLVKANDGSTTVGTSTVSDDATTAVRGVFS